MAKFFGIVDAAARLLVPRTIDGQPFDGASDITVIAPGTNAATGKTTPVDADQVPLVDSESSNVLKKLTWADLNTAANAVSGSVTNKDLTSPTNDFPAADYLTTSVTTIPRWAATSGSQQTATGLLWLTYFTADKAITINSVSMYCANTAAAATPTLCRYGIYAEDSGSGDLTLVASTANDTSLFASSYTMYTKALSAGLALTVGTRYAMGPLVVTGGTAPAFQGVAPILYTEYAIAPRIVATLTGQSDLPGSISAGSLGIGRGPLYVRATT